MSTGIKNGKLYTINIYTACLFLLFCILLLSFSSLPDPKTEGKWIIVIDPGHGGKDPGAVGLFSKEKNINLAIALKTARYIKENVKNSKVVLTREDDSTVDLIERPKIANRNNADLFISIHTNSTKGSKNVMGAETWIMGLASNEDNLEVAMKENEVILLEDDYSTKYQGFDPKSPESYIIFTLTQNVYQKQSIDLASKIQTQFAEKANRKDRGIKQAGFWVLYNTTMPSVLVETGFISTPAEEKYLNTEQGQDYLASAIFRACSDYISEIDMRSGIKVQDVATTSDSSKPNPIPTLEGSQNNSSSSFLNGQTYYMIQVAASSKKKEIKPENFNGLKDIFEIQIQERFKYVSGRFTDYDAAVVYRKKIETIYPDAFVVAVKDNKILPLQQALEQKRKK
jgi:N-acetylmuramoyl-L-alanine amidase